MKRVTIVVLAATALVAIPCAAQVDFKAMPVLQTSATVAGTPLAYPVTKTPEITGLLLEIGPGGETGRHMHPYPTFVYLLEGSIVVEADGRPIHSYKAGDAFLEVQNTWHNGKNTGKVPAKILVVFAGVKGQPNLVRPK